MPELTREQKIQLAKAIQEKKRRQSAGTPQDFSQDTGGVGGGATTSGAPGAWMNAQETAQYPLEPGNTFGMIPYQTTPKEMAQNAGNAVEIGLPTLAAGLTGGMSIPATAGLGFLGSLANRQIQSSAEGQREPIRQSIEGSVVPGLMAGAGQALGVGLNKFAGKQLAPFANQVDPEMLAITKARGIQATPSELLNESTFGSNLLKEMEKVTSSTIGGGTVIKGIRDVNNARIAQYANDILEKVAPHTDPDKLAQLLVADVDKTKMFFRSVQSALYGKVDKAMAGLPGVDTKGIKSFAQQVFDSMAPGRRELYGAAGKQPSAVMSLMQKINEMPDNIPFSDASQYVSDLKRLAGYNNTQLSDPLQGSAKKLASLFESSMENTAKGAGSNIYDLYRSASDFTRNGHRIFDDVLIKKMAETEPEQLGRTLFQPKTMESLRRMKAALSPQDFMRYQKGMFESLKQKLGTETFRRVMRSGLEEIFNSPTFTKMDVATGGDKFFKGVSLLEKLKGFGDGTLETAFGKEAKDALMQFGRVASRVETREPRIGLWGMGQLFSAFQQTALGAISGRPLYGLMSGGMVTLTPGLLAKLITNPTGRRLLTEGYELKPFTQHAITFSARLAAFAASRDTDGRAANQPYPMQTTAPASTTKVAVP